MRHNDIRRERTDDFVVHLNSYCGLSGDLTHNVTLSEAKEFVRYLLRKARLEGCAVTKIGKGEWEIETPDDAAMVSDSEGVLSIRRFYRRYRRILGRRIYID